MEKPGGPGRWEAIRVGFSADFLGSHGLNTFLSDALEAKLVFLGGTLLLYTVPEITIQPWFTVMWIFEA